MARLNKQDIWSYLSIILLAGYLIIRLVNFSLITRFFPLSRVDISSYMAVLYFLAEKGYTASVQLWYNGFNPFSVLQPGWYLFTLPFYWLFKRVELAALFSVVFMLSASFIFINRIGKLNGLSRSSRILLSLIVLANPVSIAEFLRLGRATELFGFMIFFALAVIAFHYKDRKLDLKFFAALSILMFLNIISHFSETLISFVFLLGFFMIRNWKERRMIILSGVVSIVLSSFWWIPFAKSFSQTSISGYNAAYRILDFKLWFFDSIASLILPALFLIGFYFFLKEKKNTKEYRKELLFYSPVLVLAVLLLSRLIVFLPVLKQVFPDSYNIFFTFFSALTFFRLDLSKLKVGKVAYPLLFFALAGAVIMSSAFTPWYSAHSQENKEVIELMNQIPQDSRFLVLNGEESTSIKYYDYAAIYLNLPTPAGDYEELIEKDYIETIRDLNRALKFNNCKIVDLLSSALKADYFIASGDDNCAILYQCGLSIAGSSGESCLYDKSMPI